MCVTGEVYSLKAYHKDESAEGERFKLIRILRFFGVERGWA